MEKQSLINFHDSLDENDKMLFNSVLSSFVTQNNDNRIKSLQNKLKLTIDEINKINRYRESLTKEHSKLRILNNKFNQIESKDLLFTTVQFVMFSRMNEIKTRIAETKPNSLLKEKFELNNLIISTKQRCLITEEAIKIINGK